MENLQSKLTDEMCQGRVEGKYTLTALMRKYEEDGQTYFVAECLEIPGCVADGETEDEAANHLNEAMHACVKVIFEDCLKMAKSRSMTRDFVGITSQRTVEFFAPELLHA